MIMRGLSGCRAETLAAGHPAQLMLMIATTPGSGSSAGFCQIRSENACGPINTVRNSYQINSIQRYAAAAFASALAASATGDVSTAGTTGLAHALHIASGKVLLR